MTSTCIGCGTVTSASPSLNRGTPNPLLERFSRSEAISQVRNILEQAEGPEGAHISSILTNLAEANKIGQSYAQAEALLLRALRIDVKRFGQKHREVAVDLNNLAELYRTQGKYEQAESFCLQALDIREDILGPKDPHTITSYNNLA